MLYNGLRMKQDPKLGNQLYAFGINCLIEITFTWIFQIHIFINKIYTQNVLYVVKIWLFFYQILIRINNQDFEVSRGTTKIFLRKWKKKETGKADFYFDNLLKWHLKWSIMMKYVNLQLLMWYRNNIMSITNHKEGGRFLDRN